MRWAICRGCGGDPSRNRTFLGLLVLPPILVAHRHAVASESATAQHGGVCAVLAVPGHCAVMATDAGQLVSS
jgi:hypothetical protein